MLTYYGVYRGDGRDPVAVCPLFQTANAVAGALQATEKRVWYSVRRVAFPEPAKGPQIGGSYNQLAALQFKNA